jgi:shikimate kinase
MTTVEPSNHPYPLNAPRRVYLIGFMGSGKSSIGARLAECLQWRFVDLDDLLEENAGQSIPEIFAERGEDAFRALERETLEKTFGMTDTVIAAGGGTPCFFDNMDRINDGGYSFYLRNTVDFFVDKLTRSKTERPLVKGKSPEQLRSYIVETLAKREPYYLQARYVIFVGDLGKKNSTKIIANILAAAWNPEG